MAQNVDRNTRLWQRTCASWVAKKADRRQLARGLSAALVATFLLAAFSPHPERYIVFYTFAIGIIGAFRLAYILHPNPDILLKRWEQILRLLNTLETQQKLYIRLVILTLISLALSIVATPLVIVASFGFTMCFAAHVAFYDLRRWYRYVSETLLGKALLTLALAISTGVAYSFACERIGKVVHVTPTNLTHTILFVSILMIPVLMTLSGGLVYFFAGVIMPFSIMLLDMSKKIPTQLKDWLFVVTLPKSTQTFPFATRLFQMIFYATLGISVYLFGGKGLELYEKKMPGMVSWLVYKYDMYPGRECKLENYFKLAPLGDAKFLVAKQDADGTIIFFDPIKCDDLPTTLSQGQSGQ